jgi:hypothetical protein
MDLKEIMSVSGHSGLFKFVTQGRNGIIVESFTDKKRMFVNATQKVSSLGDIAIFTEGEEVPLKDVFKKIHDSNPGIQAPDPKSAPEDLKIFMEKILPEYDRNRVYVSDIKKLVAWYNSLLAMDLLSFEEEQPATEAEAGASSDADPITEVKETEIKNKKKEKKPKQPAKTPASYKKAPKKTK